MHWGWSMTCERGGRGVLAAAAATILALLGMLAPAQAAPIGTTVATGPALVTRDLGGAYHSEKMAGPLTGGSSLTSPGLVMLGVNTDPTGCVSIAFGPWRGAIHPRLTTTVGVYDWGWYANAPANLNC
jgi:hypothetical protein